MTVPPMSGPKNLPPVIGTMRRLPLPTSPRSSGGSTDTSAAKINSSVGAVESTFAISASRCHRRQTIQHLRIFAMPMDVRAAVAFGPGKPLEVTTVKLDGPRAGEVLVEIKATGICHTDEFTLSGADP